MNPLSFAAVTTIAVIGLLYLLLTVTKSKSYDSLFAKLGFVEVKLRPMQVGLFFAEGEVSNQAAVIVIDTGASHTLMDKASADRWGVSYTRTEKHGAGAGASNLEFYKASGISLIIDGFDLELESIGVIDLSHMKRTMTARGLEMPDVILGGDVMRAREAKVDYARSSLFLKRVLDNSALAK